MPRFARLAMLAIVALALMWGGSAEAEKPSKSTKKPKQQCPLMMAMDYPYQINNNDWTYIQAVVLTPDAKPAKGAKMTINGKKAGKTDEHGTFIYEMKLKDWGNGGSYTLAAQKKWKGSLCSSALSFNAYPRTKSFNTQELYVYTDRAVYNPGQKILLRALAWYLEGEYSPLVGKEVEYLLSRDSDSVIVAGGTMTTSKFGTAHSSIQLPDTIEEGDYTLKITYEKGTEETTLVIKRFRPPVMNIQNDIPRFLTTAATSLAFSVEPTYFLGGKPTSGTMTVTAKKDTKELWSTKVSLADQAKYDFSLDGESLATLKKALTDGDKFKITVALVDGFGREDEFTRRLTYKENPYTAVIELDKDQYTKGEKVNAMVKVVDIEGVPTKDTPFILELSGGVSTNLGSKTDDTGTAQFEFEMPSSSVTLTLKKVDVPVSIATSTAPLIPPKAMLSKIVDAVVKEATKSTIRITFGDDHQIVEDVVHVDMVDGSGSLVNAFTVPVKKVDGKQVAEGTFSSPTWGTILFTIYAAGCHESTCKKTPGFDTVGLLTEGQQIAVLPNKEIEIKLDGFPDTAKPGETISFKALFKAVTKDTKEFAVGAALVDKGVLSMKDPFEQTPMDKFYNPQKKTMASGGSKILTWPVVKRNWGSPQHDIALPPFGYKGPGSAPTYFAPSDQKKYNASAGDVDMDEGGAGGAGGYGGSGISKGTMGFSGSGLGGGGYGAASKSSSGKAYKKAPKVKMSNAKISGSADKFSFEDDTLANEPAPMEAEKSIDSLLAGPTADGDNRPKAQAGPPVTITIRKEFPETAMWSPDLVAKGGSLGMEIPLPDSLTTHQLVLVASDDKGGVGLFKKDITVTQALFVRSDLPAVVTMGDEVTVAALVHNGTDAPQETVVSVASPALEVTSAESVTLSLPAHTDGVAAWKIKATKAGKVTYTVKAMGPTFIDSEEKELFVAPKGMPLVKKDKAVLTGKEKVSFEVDLPADAPYHTTTLSATFPTAIPLLQGIERMVAYPYGCAEQRASITYMNAIVYDYLAKHKLLSEDKRKALRGLMEAAVPGLLAFQNADGGWSWFYQKGSNVLLTAYLVEVLSFLRTLDIYVPEASITGAIAYLKATMTGPTGWSAKDVYFYKKGEDASWNTALTAEIFRILASAYQTTKDPTLEGMLANLSDAMIGVLQKEKNDPMVISNAALGLALYTKKKGKPKQYAKQLDKAAKQLVELRKTGYWEPDWFHAYGGTVEATVTSLMLLQQLDPDKYAAEYRDGVKYLLATGESFGAWHNTHGTAAAIKLLASLDPAQEKKGGATVTVYVNEGKVQEVPIDPKDPFLSAMALAQLDLTSHLVPGKNTVTVAYDGLLEAPVSLTHQVWPSVETAPSSDAVVKVERTYSKDTVKVAEPFEATITVSSAEPMAYVVLVEPKPSVAGFDEASFDDLVSSGVILSYKIEDDACLIYLDQIGAEPLSITYELLGERAGTALQKGPQAEPMYRADLTGAGADTPLTVVN